MNQISLTVYGFAVLLFCMVATACYLTTKWIFAKTPNITLEQRHKIQERKIKKAFRVFIEVGLLIGFIGAIIYRVVK